MAKNLALYERAVFKKEEREAMIATGKAIVFLTVGSAENEDEILLDYADHETIGKAMLDFLKLRKNKLFILFIMDYTESDKRTCSMNFYFDQKLVESVEYCVQFNLDEEEDEEESDNENNDTEMAEEDDKDERVDRKILEAMDALQGKMLEKLTPKNSQK